MPGPRPRPGSGDDPLMLLAVQTLGGLAAAAIGRPATAGDIGDVLSDVLESLRLLGDLSRGVYPPRGTVRRRSKASEDLEPLFAAAIRHYREFGGAVRPPSALAAGLAIAAAAAWRDHQPGTALEQDMITLEEAAGLLGVKSPERIRQLVHGGKITGFQDHGGRRRWRVSRASVIAYRDGRSNHGAGSDDQAA